MIYDSVQDVLPVLLKKDLGSNPSGQALIDYLDSANDETIESILEMYYFKAPCRIPSQFLEELGYLLSAGILDIDSDFTKRYKIETAIESHKKRGSWENDAKLRIDSITGYDARLYSAPGQDDWILVGTNSEPSTYYTAILGADGIDDGYGISLIGEGDEIYVAGNIYINCHYGIYTAVLTSDQIEDIKTQLEYDVAPGYMRLILGYATAANQFIEYPNGRIE